MLLHGRLLAGLTYFMIQQKSITHNSAYSLVSTLVQKGLTLFYFILVARAFGPQDQGRYSAALAFSTLFGVFIDLGLSSALTRETARHPERASEYFGQMIFIRLALSAVVYGVIVFSAYAIGYPDELVALIIIAGLATCVDVLSTSFWAMMRGFQNLKYEAFGGVLAIGVMIAGGTAAIIAHMPVKALVYATLAGSACNCVYAFSLLVRKAKLIVSLTPHLGTLRTLAVLTAPFAAAAIFSRIYTFSDMAILARLGGEHAAGFYAAGNKLILALNMVPAAISSSIFPALSAAFIREPEKMKGIYYRAHFFLLLISFPMAVGLFLLARPIVLLFYGPEYLPTIDVLRALSPSLLFGFIMFPVGALLSAANRQHVNTIVFGVAATVNVCLNFLLIGPLGPVGSALAATATTATIFLLSFGAAHPQWKEHAKDLAVSVFKISVASAFMAGSILFYRDQTNVVWTIFIAIGAYCIFVLLLGIIPFSDVMKWKKEITRL